MNVGPGGFGHAPVTKGVLFAALGCSIISNAARASHRQLPKPLVLLSRSLAFQSSGELLFGCFLLYYFRVLERQAGSRKFGSYAAIVTGLSYMMQFGLASVLQLKIPLPPGPLPLVFASFVPFLLDVPPTSNFTVLGCSLSDKSFVYLAGLQLVLASGRKSLLALATSALAGLLYKMNFCNISKLRVPAPIVRVVSQLLGPLLVDPRHSGPSIVTASMTSAAAAAAGPGAPGRAAADGFGQRAQRRAGAGAGEGGAAGLQQRHAGAAAGGLPAPSLEALQYLLDMGFTQEQATQALQQAGNDLQTAIALLVG